MRRSDPYAAFAAAAGGAPIDMARLCHAVSRQLLKQGMVPSASEFRDYKSLLVGGDAANQRMAAE
jgi:hypothetical protein